MGERLRGRQVVLAQEPGHVEQHRPADDTALGDRLDAGLFQATDRGAGVVAVPDLPVEPDVPECVVLRRALQEGVDLVVGVVQPTRVRRAGAALVPVGLVQDLGALGRRTAGPDRVALRVTDQPLQGEGLARAHQAGGGQDLLRAEVVERTDLVVRAPLAPVAGRVLQQIAEVGGGGLRLGHDGSSGIRGPERARSGSGIRTLLMAVTIRTAGADQPNGTMSGAPSRAASAVSSFGWRCASRSADTRFS